MVEISSPVKVELASVHVKWQRVASGVCSVELQQLIHSVLCTTIAVGSR